MTVQRYHPALVSLHWLIAVAVILGLAVGPIMAALPMDAKIQPLRGHMAINLVIGFLIIVRIAVRLCTKTPAPVSAGNVWLDRLRRIVHVLLYVTILSMVSTGLGMAMIGDLFGIVYGGQSSGFPPDFDFATLPPRAGHAFFAGAVTVLVVIHAAAALYHQFVLKDGLLARMWFGQRFSATAPDDE